MFLIFEIIFRNNKTGKKYMTVNQIREIKLSRNQQFFANCLIREIFFPRNFVAIKYINFNFVSNVYFYPLLPDSVMFDELTV